MKNKIINSSVVLFSILFTLGLVEVGTRIFYGHEFRNHFDFRKTQPAPYENSAYFSADFLQESLFEQPGEFINPEGTRIILPGDFEGDFFNVKNNLRVTTNEPDSFSNKIHLFGGSTVYNAEVPDNHTIASYLQRKINTAFPNKFKVVNHGVTSINTAQQLEKLETIALDTGDLVIFYAGVNDALLFTSGRIDGWIIGENMMAKNDKMNRLHRWKFQIYRNFRTHSDFVDKFFNPFSYQIPSHLKDEKKIAAMREQLAISYQHSIAKSDSICRKNGVQFFNFIQPYILTRKENTTYEKELLKNDILVPEAWMIALKNSYSILLESNLKFKEKGIFSEDLAGLFDENSEEHYLDYCHVTERGNELAAVAIFEKIKLLSGQ